MTAVIQRSLGLRFKYVTCPLQCYTLRPNCVMPHFNALVLVAQPTICVQFCPSLSWPMLLKYTSETYRHKHHPMGSYQCLFLVSSHPIVWAVSTTVPLFEYDWSKMGPMKCNEAPKGVQRKPEGRQTLHWPSIGSVLSPTQLCTLGRQKVCILIINLITLWLTV